MFEIQNGILLKYYGDETRIIIPDDVISINQCVFSDCQNLEEIVIPDTVTNIGDFAFENCYNLSLVFFGKNIENIGNKIFYNCFALKAVYFNSKQNFTKEELYVPSNCEIFNLFV